MMPDDNRANVVVAVIALLASVGLAACLVAIWMGW